MTAATAERMGVSFEDFMSAAAATTAVRRIGLPDDVAGAVSFLLSEDASFISGQVIYLAGGPTD
jgi:3-oxoacyl-[acyl-carrier protein] reductase